MKIATLICDDDALTALKKDENGFVPMTDSDWRSKIDHYDHLTDKAKLKFIVEKLKSAKNRCKARIMSRLPNAHRKMWTQHGKSLPSADDYRQGLLAFLALADLFQSPAIGLVLIATILCGLRAYAMRSVEPAFVPMMAITSSDQMLQLLGELIRFIVPRERWRGKRCVVKRTAILNFAENSDNIVNFSRVRVKHKKIKSVWLPFPYTDTVALVANAKGKGKSWRAVAEYLRNAGTIFFNCKLFDEWGPTKLPRYSITVYDQDIADNILAHGHQIAAFLRLWWDSSPQEDWAERVIRAAKDSIGRIDGRFTAVQYDSQMLRSAIYRQVLESLFKNTQLVGLMSEDELAPYRQAVQDTFDPPPPESTKPRRAEDAEVFLAVMSKLVNEHPDCVAGIDEPCYKGRRPFSAAWRDISGVHYLVVEEESWKIAYAKAVRTDKQIDSSILQLKDWDLEVLKDLVGAEVIKAASSGYRYRYDLFRSGSKVNVVAIAADRLDG